MLESDLQQIQAIVNAHPIEMADLMVEVIVEPVTTGLEQLRER